MTNLIGYFGGICHTGATYEIEITDEGGTYRAQAFSAAAGGPRQGQTLVYNGPFLESAFAEALKQARKKYNGSPRAYNTPLPTTLQAGATTQPLPAKLVCNELPMHPQLWQAGRDTRLLPSAQRSRAASTLPGAPAVTPASVASATPAPAPAPAPAQPTLPALLVMLCDEVDTPMETEALLRDDNWIAMRKWEGRRGQIHIVDGGKVVMTTRSGRTVECPAHIADVAKQLPNGTTLDGELVAVDDNGKEALYAGAAATNQIYIAYDLVHSPLLPDGQNTPQLTRLGLLATLLASLGDQSAIFCGTVAATEAEKREMLEQGKADEWEGLIFRKADAPYVGRRSPDWRKLKFLRREYDALVVGYQDGTGRLAGSVGAVTLAMYDGDPTAPDGAELVEIGQVGSGFTDEQRADLAERRARGKTGYVIVVTSEGFTADGKLNRPVAVAIRDPRDKAPEECILPDSHPRRASAPAKQAEAAA